MSILQPRLPKGHTSRGAPVPFYLEDPRRLLNEFAVIHTEPRQVVLISSFSNPQARIVAPEYRFMWWEGEAMYEAGAKLSKPLIANAKQMFPTIMLLADTEGVVDEIALIKGQDRQIANFSFKQRYVALHRPGYHIEWTEGVQFASANDGLLLGPEALR